MDAVWVNGTIQGVGWGTTGAALYDGDPTNGRYMQFTITSVTDTGFTITWTESGTFSVTASDCVWEAEGEQ